MAFSRGEIVRAIREQSSRHQLDAELVAAVVFQESLGDPYALRKEEGFYTKYMKGKTDIQLGGYFPPETKCSHKTEISARYHSWGLMQVLGQVARELGCKNTFLSALVDPQLGVFYGCKKLQQCMGQEFDKIYVLPERLLREVFFQP